MLAEIFSTFFKIGCFTIGGGYAMIPIIQREVVESKEWISEEEFLDALAITNSLPGPLAINCATYVGYKQAGIIGSFIAVSATALPSFFIILAIATFFTSLRDNQIVQSVFNGIRPAVVALILFAVIRLAKSIGLTRLNIAISLGTLIAIIFLNIHPLFTIIISGLIGFFFLRRTSL